MKLPNLFQKKLTPEGFWTWFAANAEALKTGDLERNMVQIGEKLAQVDADFCPGLAPLPTHFQLEISAGGIKSVAPRVLEMVRAAPSIPGWKIVAFRQPMDPPCIRMGNQEIDLAHTKFVVTGRDQNLLNIRLFVPVPVDCPKDILGELGFLGLDHTLGEEMVMTRLGEIEFDNIVSAPPTAQLISELVGLLSTSTNGN